MHYLSYNGTIDKSQSYSETTALIKAIEFSENGNFAKVWSQPHSFDKSLDLELYAHVDETQTAFLRNGMKYSISKGMLVNMCDDLLSRGHTSVG